MEATPHLTRSCKLQQNNYFTSCPSSYSCTQSSNTIPTISKKWRVLCVTSVKPCATATLPISISNSPCRRPIRFRWAFCWAYVSSATEMPRRRVAGNSRGNLSRFWRLLTWRCCCFWRLTCYKVNFYALGCGL